MVNSYITTSETNENGSGFTVSKNTLTPSTSMNFASVFSTEPFYMIANTTADIFSEVANIIRDISNDTS